MRVLIVDDQPLAQTALASILSARSDVEHFDSANDAIEGFGKLATARAHTLSTAEEGGILVSDAPT